MTSADKKVNVIAAMFRPIVVASLAPVFLATLAYAQADLLTRLDVDKDQKVSLKEAVRNPELLKNFGLIDEDGDGMLTRTELEASDLTAATDDHSDD